LLAVAAARPADPRVGPAGAQGRLAARTKFAVEGSTKSRPDQQVAVMWKPRSASGLPLVALCTRTRSVLASTACTLAKPCCVPSSTTVALYAHLLTSLSNTTE